MRTRIPDLLKLLFDPLREAVRTGATGLGLTATQAGAVVDLFDVIGMTAVALLMVPVASRLYARAHHGRGDPWRVAAAAGAGALLWWIVRHPSSSPIDFFARWDHVAFSALAGGVLAGATPAVRVWTLGLLNVTVMWQYAGAVATPVILGTSIVAYLALGLRGGNAALALAALGGAVCAGCWYWRATAIGHAVQTVGLFALIYLRQISAAATLAGTPRPPLGAYVCYLTYYPGGFGLVSGPEVYSDFARRNFGERLHYNAFGAVRSIGWGALQIWMARLVPVGFDDLQRATTMVEMWQTSLLLFARTALFGMGLWAVTAAIAAFHGFRLHPNFHGILTRRNPTELWWAWRGAFTNWLVRHVYAPLVTHHQPKGLAIFAAFAVSWAWHVAGYVFIAKNPGLLTLAPITAWWLVNAAAVVGHQFVRDRGIRILPAATPEPLRRAIHTFLTACLGSFSVTFLSYQGDPAGLWRFLRVLFGLGD